MSLLLTEKWHIFAHSCLNIHWIFNQIHSQLSNWVTTQCPPEDSGATSALAKMHIIGHCIFLVSGFRTIRRF